MHYKKVEKVSEVEWQLSDVGFISSSKRCLNNVVNPAPRQVIPAETKFRIVGFTGNSSARSLLQ